MSHRRTAALLGIAAGAMLATACGSGPSAEARLRQGMIYANQGDYPNAINEFNGSIALRPSAAAYSNLGVAYMQTGKKNLAFDALKRAEAIAPRDSLVLYNLAAYHSVMDNTDLSLEYLDRALSNGFSNYDAIRFDPDLENLRGEPEFRSVLERHKVFIQ